MVLPCNNIAPDVVGASQQCAWRCGHRGIHIVKDMFQFLLFPRSHQSPFNRIFNMPLSKLACFFRFRCLNPRPPKASGRRRHVRHRPPPLPVLGQEKPYTHIETFEILFHQSLSYLVSIVVASWVASFSSRFGHHFLFYAQRLCPLRVL